jgi:hypothetical protein
MVGICDQRWPWAGHQEGEDNAQQIMWLGYGSWDKTGSSEVKGKSVECLMHWIFPPTWKLGCFSANLNRKHENLIRWSSELCLCISVWASSEEYGSPNMMKSKCRTLSRSFPRWFPATETCICFNTQGLYLGALLICTLIYECLMSLFVF